MKKEKIITLEKYCEKNLTKSERTIVNQQAKKRISLREVKNLRKQNNLTQFDLSKKTGIPRSTISKIETGQRNVSVDKLVQIANALDKDLQIRFVERKKNN